MSVPDVGHSESPSHPHWVGSEAQFADWLLPAITFAHVTQVFEAAPELVATARARMYEAGGIAGGGRAGGGVIGGVEGGGATRLTATTSLPATPSNGRRLLLWETETVTNCAEVSPTLAPEMLSNASFGGDSHSKYTRSRADNETASACARTSGDPHWPAAPSYVHANRAA